MRKVAVIYGSAGIGKTQLAAQFARTRKGEFTAVLWLNGRDQTSATHSLSLYAPRILGENQTEGDARDGNELKERARQVLAWLAAEDNSKWLIIIDGVSKYTHIHSYEEEAFNIHELFPAADHGSIIVTSRDPQFTSFGQPHAVESLELEEATKLVLNVVSPTTYTGKTTAELDTGSSKPLKITCFVMYPSN